MVLHGERETKQENANGHHLPTHTLYIYLRILLTKLWEQSFCEIIFANEQLHRVVCRYNLYGQFERKLSVHMNELPLRLWSLIDTQSDPNERRLHCNYTLLICGYMWDEIPLWCRGHWWQLFLLKLNFTIWVNKKRFQNVETIIKRLTFNKINFLTHIV